MSLHNTNPPAAERAAQEAKWEFIRTQPYAYHCTGEALKDVAKKAFFEQSNVYKWTGEAGEYTIWAYKNVGEMSRAEHAWPHAFVHGESQTINAGMWIPTENNEFKLVAVWTFSVKADGTYLYYLPDCESDVWAFAEACEEDNPDSPITSEASAEHFFGVGGDSEADKFTCFSLDIISASEMEKFEAAYRGEPDVATNIPVATPSDEEEDGEEGEEEEEEIPKKKVRKEASRDEAKAKKN